jgi:hypothetical protein
MLRKPKAKQRLRDRDQVEPTAGPALSVFPDCDRFSRNKTLVMRQSGNRPSAQQRPARAVRSGIASGHDCSGLDHQDHTPFGRARAMQHSLRHRETLIGQQLD